MAESPRAIHRLAPISIVGACIAGMAGAAAQTNNSPPNFATDAASAWHHVGPEMAGMPGYPGPVHDDPAHPHVGNLSGGQPTYNIPDLSDPNLTQWAKDIMKKDTDEVLAGKIAYRAHQSCEPSGVPDFDMIGGARPLYFLQTPTEVLIFWEGDPLPRHIYLNVPHSANPKPSWDGESVGHYEGNSLVIDTIGQSLRTFVDEYRTPHSDRLHVQERWTLADDGKTLTIAVQVDDPVAFKQPWSGTTKFQRRQEPWIEIVCAENNEHFDFHIPVAKKPDF